MTGRVVGWRRWLTGVAYVLGVLAVILLALTPAVLSRRVQLSLVRFQNTIVPASELVTELRVQVERQASTVRGYALSADPGYLADYRAARTADDEAFDRLLLLAPQIGPSFESQLHLVRALALRERAVNDSLVAGHIAPGRFISRLDVQERRLDAVLTQAARLREDIVRVVEARGANLHSDLARLRLFAILLGVVAVMAAVLVAWFVRRQEALSVAVARAAAEERRLRALAEHRREDVERITESRTRLMRGFSHDVKNPLGAADGYLQLLEEGVMDHLTPEQQEGVAKARRSIAAALHLIEDLLELARAESGRIEVGREPVDVREVVRDAAEAYRAQAEAKDLAMAIELPDEFPEIESDADRIRQVVGNLLSNAVKYTDRGGVTVRASVRRNGEAPSPGRWVVVEVADTGPGIPEDQMRLLFQEFARLPAGAERRGAGIGLASGRRIARALGGDITVESELGRGSRFSLWLPERGRGAGQRPTPAE